MDPGHLGTLSQVLSRLHVSTCGKLEGNSPPSEQRDPTDMFARNEKLCNWRVVTWRSRGGGREAGLKRQPGAAS